MVPSRLTFFDISMASEVWLEKYRPKTLDDVVGNVSAVDRLRVTLKEGTIPNIILSGPPGTGKTSCVLCIARALLGPIYKEAVLELNASDERGIDAVRNKIKTFAQKKVTLPPGRQKIIILDEVDRFPHFCSIWISLTLPSLFLRVYFFSV
jgi:replication factor C subunit 2/4